MSTETLEKPTTTDNTTDHEPSHAYCILCNKINPIIPVVRPGATAMCGWVNEDGRTQKPNNRCVVCVDLARKPCRRCGH